MADQPSDKLPRRNRADHLIEYRFRPGESGNPGGRPKGRSVISVLRELLDAEYLCDQPVPGGRRVVDALAEVALAHAIKGKHHYFREIMDRLYGRQAPDKQSAAAAREAAEEIDDSPPPDLDPEVAARMMAAGLDDGWGPDDGFGAGGFGAGGFGVTKNRPYDPPTD